MSALPRPVWNIIFFLLHPMTVITLVVGGILGAAIIQAEMRFRDRKVFIAECIEFQTEARCSELYFNNRRDLMKAKAP
jgi:hypothetical protein